MITNVKIYTKKKKKIQQQQKTGRQIPRTNGKTNLYRQNLTKEHTPNTLTKRTK